MYKFDHALYVILIIVEGGRCLELKSNFHTLIYATPLISHVYLMYSSYIYTADDDPALKFQYPYMFCLRLEHVAYICKRFLSYLL